MVVTISPSREIEKIGTAKRERSSSAIDPPNANHTPVAHAATAHDRIAVEIVELFRREAGHVCVDTQLCHQVVERSEGIPDKRDSTDDPEMEGRPRRSCGSDGRCHDSVEL
jgi:hypothetical protein